MYFVLIYGWFLIVMLLLVDVKGELGKWLWVWVEVGELNLDEIV